MDKEQVLAMAIAVLAEETGQEIKKIRVKSFKEYEKSDLEKYIEEKKLTYKKYQLGD